MCMSIHYVSDFSRQLIAYLDSNSVRLLHNQTYMCPQHEPSVMVCVGWGSPKWCCRKGARRPGRQWRCMWSSWRPPVGLRTSRTRAACSRRTTPLPNWRSTVPRTTTPATANAIKGLVIPLSIYAGCSTALSVLLLCSVGNPLVLGPQDLTW